MANTIEGLGKKYVPNTYLAKGNYFSLNKDLQLEAKEEFRELCMSSGAGVCAEITCKIDRPSPNYFVKLGKLNEIRELVKINKCGLIIFNNEI